MRLYIRPLRTVRGIQSGRSCTGRWSGTSKPTNGHTPTDSNAHRGPFVRLLATHTHAEIATILNDADHVSGTGKTFHANRVGKVIKAYHLKTRYARLRETGLLTLTEIAKKLGVCRATVKIRRAEGRLGVRAIRLDDVGRYLYEDPETAESIAQEPSR